MLEQKIKPTIMTKKKLFFLFIAIETTILLLILRVFYIQTVKAPMLQAKAYEQQTRDRLITPNRGSILDRNMKGIAETQTVASISVIHNQIKDEDQVARELSTALELDHEETLTKVKKKVALERIKTKVDKEKASEIRKLQLPGVVIDEDIQRIYPYNNLASQVIGFVGKDNQGIIGLEAYYNDYLKGSPGKILTETDVKGREMRGGGEYRIDPEDGYNIVTTLDLIVQQYAEQTLEKVVNIKQAQKGLIVIMDPNNGEIYAMANKPDFNLNEPFEINNETLKATWDTLSAKEQADNLNKMWRNFSINDTYEPGSTFKIITSAAGLEENKVTLDSSFNCGGGLIVGGRYIKCWRHPMGHGHQSFVEGVQNSCNPVFMEVASRLGSDTFYDYMVKFGFSQKTGIDVPGEAVGIMHAKNKIGPVELATISFGQSFQITPLQLLRAASATVNGGHLITPHFAKQLVDTEGNLIKTFEYEKSEPIISEETSKEMRFILESVVHEGTGNKTYIPGYRVGGKTATSEKLPRRSGKYIASFLAMAPAESPELIALVLVDEPQGAYYGGQVTGPVMKELLDSVLPYLKVETNYSAEEARLDIATKVKVENYVGMTVEDAQELIKKIELVSEVLGDGEVVSEQFPPANEDINKNSKVILYTDPKYFSDYEARSNT